MKLIHDALQHLAKDKQVDLLYACETGSRAWGFPSPDSDYDVRFIYKHNVDWYLSLSEKKDTIALMDGDLDITGWDLRKALRLLRKSNASLIERFTSPIEYAADLNFREGFLNLVKDYYSPTAVFFHHYSLAKGFWENLKDKDEFRLKSFFYLIRSLLSCHWIIHETSVVPMRIEKLLSIMSDDFKSNVNALIALKATVNESYLHKKDVYFNNWIVNTMALLESSKDNLGVPTTSPSSMDEFFLKTIYGKANDRNS